MSETPWAISLVRNRLWVALLAGCLLPAACCQRPEQSPATPDEALVALDQAVRRGSPKAVFALLDQQTKWSVMSTRRAQIKVRQLVRQHYPADRVARELERTRLAGQSQGPAEYFMGVARARGMLTPLKGLGDIDRREVSGRTATLRSGEVGLRFCREDAAWRYCGARETFEQLKVRASRDLEVVQEGVDRGLGGG